MQAHNLFIDIPEPDFRVEFKLLLSLNDVNSLDRFATGQKVKLWRERACARAVTSAKQSGIPTEEYTEMIERPYRGKNVAFKGSTRKVFITGTRLRNAFFNEQTLLVIRFWKPTQARYDILNLMIKPILDGFVDARVLPDDNTTFLPLVVFSFGGVDSTLQLSSKQKQARQLANARKKYIDPPANKRIWFDFYMMERVRNEPILQSISDFHTQNSL